jgi:hypothetical protein
MERQVFLTEMDAVGVAGEHDIGAVVDDETAVVGPRQTARALGELEEVPGRHGFRAQLNQLRAAFQELAQDGLGIASSGLLGVENGVKRREQKSSHQVLRSSLS